MKKYKFEYFASCPGGLEDLLTQEILDLGAQTAKKVRGGVQFECHHEIALKTILYSRIASRVFKYLYAFECQNEKDFYLEATDVKWKSLMDVEHTFRLTTIFGDLPFEREEFRNSQFATLKLKDAIVDYFRHFEGTRPSVAKDFPDISFLTRIDRGIEKPYLVTLMYDLCGDPLNQRGYRLAKTEAPVKENVAAGILKLAGWNPETESLLDAMCGSGTFIIEGALMAGKIPPSYLKVERHLRQPEYKLWTFQNYPWFTQDAELMGHFKQYVADITEATEKGIAYLNSRPNTLAGNELSEMVLISATENVRKAKLDTAIKLTRGDALKTTPLEGKTLFICNPPYGERLDHGEDEKLKALYKGLGDHWKNQFKGNRAALFTGNLEMLKVVGLKTAKRHILYNGDIECRLAEYNLY